MNMTIKNSIKKIIVHILILLSIGLLQLKINYNYGFEGCYGMSNGLIMMFLYFAALIILIIGTIKILKSNDNIRTKVFAISLMLLSPILISIQQIFEIKKIKNEVQISAVQPNARISLRKNNYFTVIYRSVEMTCYKSGNYFNNNDTIELEGDFLNSFSIKFANKYLMQNNKLIAIDHFDNEVLDEEFEIENNK